MTQVQWLQGLMANGGSGHLPGTVTLLFILGTCALMPQQGGAVQCWVRIRPTTSPVPYGIEINLAEVQLFGANGSMIPDSSLTANLSTVWAGGNGALNGSNCIDGNIIGINPDICNSAVSDFNPQLNITYPCAAGLSKVVVYNRWDGAQYRMNWFTLDALVDDAVMQTSKLDYSQMVTTINIGQCSVSIRPTFSPVQPASAAISLAEVQLFNASGALIPTVSLQSDLSSTLVGNNSYSLFASYCTDGRTNGTLQAGSICQTAMNDTYPILSIQFPCSGGLSKVVVNNRNDCCTDQLGAFSLDVVMAGKVVKTVSLAGTSSTNIAIPISGDEPILPSPTQPTPAPTSPSGPLRGPPPSRCWVRIRPNTSPAIQLNLAEVQLFGANGSMIPPKTLTAALSSVQVDSSGPLIASKCTDGDINGTYPAICSTDPSDTNPSLHVTYPCTMGLSKVVVTNRWDCCQSNINSFSLDALVDNAVMQTYQFTGSKMTYTIDIGQCSVSVRPISSPVQPAGTQLNLAEVQLYSLNGSLIPFMSLTPQLSSLSTVQPHFFASYCTDGNMLGEIIAGRPYNNPVCQTGETDPAPVLSIQFPCSSGLSQVILYNRVDCCSDSINSFALDVVMGGRIQMTYSFADAGSHLSYQLNISGDTASGSPAQISSQLSQLFTLMSSDAPAELLSNSTLNSTFTHAISQQLQLKCNASYVGLSWLTATSAGPNRQSAPMLILMSMDAASPVTQQQLRAAVDIAMASASLVPFTYSIVPGVADGTQIPQVITPGPASQSLSSGKGNAANNTAGNAANNAAGNAANNTAGTLAPGAVAGITCGVVAGVAALAAAVMLVMKQRRKTTHRQPSSYGSGKLQAAFSIEVSTGSSLGTPMHIPGLQDGEVFVRYTASAYGWCKEATALDTCQAVEAGITDSELDQLASKEPNGSMNCPIVQLSKQELKEQVQLLPEGLVGTGGSAYVFKCIWPSRFGNGLLAAKVLKDDSNLARLATFSYEAKVLLHARHSNIVRLYGYCLDPPAVCLILEYLPYSLKDFIKGFNTMNSLPAPSAAAVGGTGSTASDVSRSSAQLPHTEPVGVGTTTGVGADAKKKPSLLQVLQLSTQVAAGLAFLHGTHAGVALPEEEECSSVHGDRSTRVVHRDLKPANVLLNTRSIAKISDFGLAREHERTTVNTVYTVGAGTLPYMAPELLIGDGVPRLTPTNRVDIYSLAMLIWELLTGQTPWRGLTDAAILASVVAGRRPALPGLPDSSEAAPLAVEMGAISGSEAMLHALTELIKDCWAQRDLRRPRAAEVHARLAGLLQQLSAQSAPAEPHVVVAVRVQPAAGVQCTQVEVRLQPEAGAGSKQADLQQQQQQQQQQQPAAGEPPTKIEV